MAAKKKQRSKLQQSDDPIETRAAEVATVGWTVMLTTVFFCNLAAILAHLLAAGNPEAQRMAMLRELLLFAGMLTGVMSLAMLPVVQRLRQVPPPRGLVAFGVCIALAPMLAIVLRLVR